MLNCRFICLFSRWGTRLNSKKTSRKMLDFNKICLLIHTINNVNGYFSIFKTKQTSPDQHLLTSDTRCERDWLWSVFQFHFASVVKLHDSNHPTLWHLTHRGKLVNFCTRSSATREKSDFLSLEQHARLSLEVIGTFLNFTLSSINPSFVFSWHLVGRQISNKCFLRLFSLKLTLLAVGKMSACCCLEFKICDYLVFGEPLKIVIVFKIRFAASLFPSGAGRAFPLCACCQQRVWIRRQCSVVGSVGSWMIPFFPVCVLFFRRGGGMKRIMGCWRGF